MARPHRDETGTFDLAAVRKLLEENDVFCSFDCESTGLDTKTSEVVEIYAEKFTITGEVLDTFHHFCRPLAGMIPKGAFDAHGISYEMVKDKPSYFADGINLLFEEFARGTVLVGQNIIRYDMPLIRISSDKVFDTMVWGKYFFPGGRVNNRSLAEKFKVKYDPAKAHGAKYDAKDLTKEIFLKMAQKLAPQGLDFDTIDITGDQKEEEVGEPIIPFVEVPRINMSVEAISGIVKRQAYSYSRLSSYVQCPYKWYLNYVEGVKEGPQSHFTIGHICHGFAQFAGEYCYRQTMAARAALLETEFMEKLKITPEFTMKMAGLGKPVDAASCVHYFLTHPASIQFDTAGDFKKLSTMLNWINANTSDEDVEMTAVTYPDSEVEADLIERAVVENQCQDAAVIKDSRFIIRGFGRVWRFRTNSRTLLMQERKLCFDKDWKILSDFMDKNAYFRMVIDGIEFGIDYIYVSDWKTNRVMPSRDELEQDNQLKCYVMGLVESIPGAANFNVIAENRYMRYGEAIPITIGDAKATAEAAKRWIATVVDQIQGELTKPIEHMFAPFRNEFCGTCGYQASRCPLFNRALNNTITHTDDFEVTDTESCMRAWKQVEANKAENKNLNKKVRTFLTSNNSIVIDGRAVLDIYKDTSRKIDAFMVWKELQDVTVDGLNTESILQYMGMSPTDFDKLLKRFGVVLTQEQIDAVTLPKISNKLACRVNPFGDEGDDEED